MVDASFSHYSWGRYCHGHPLTTLWMNMANYKNYHVLLWRKSWCRPVHPMKRLSVFWEYHIRRNYRTFSNKRTPPFFLKSWRNYKPVPAILHVWRSSEVALCTRDKRRHIIYFTSESSPFLPWIHVAGYSGNPILVGSHLWRNKPDFQGPGNWKVFVGGASPSVTNSQKFAAFSAATTFCGMIYYC